MSKEGQSSPPTRPARSPRPPRLIVGVGASAGGLDAFSKLLEALPADTGLAFVLIQHLSPDHKSMMVDLLKKHTSMPVQEASDGAKVKANHIYMIPPDSILTISDGKLNVARPNPSRHGRPLPIDEFLISLADDAAERSAGVILSGTGSDGTAGIKAIKEAGGVVLVESPETAAYPGMPRSAAATGLADMVMSVPELAEKLVSFGKQPHLTGAKKSQIPQGLGPKEILLIIEALHVRTGYDFREYKKPTLSRRIQRRMGLRNVSDPKVYVDLVNKDDSEAQALFKDMLIGVTTFFRDRDAFADLRKRVLTPLVKEHSGKRPIRVWIPGCATGEEAYTVAILLSEEFARQGLSFNGQIFATDIDADAIDRARTGRYSGNVANEIPEDYLKTYFEEDEGGFAVKKQLRESVTFAVQNLIGDPPFSKLDLICCRNVLIYLESSMQDKLLQLFHFALNDDGFLFLGTSESTTRQESLFSSVSKQHRIFRRTPMDAQRRQRYNEHRIYSFNKSTAQISRGGAIDSITIAFSPAEATRNALLNHYAPPAVLINVNYEILYFQGETGPFLNQPEGEPTNDLSAITAEGLKTKIRAAVQKARRTGDKAMAQAQSVRKKDGGRMAVEVTAHPVQKSDSGEQLFLITFSEMEPPKGRAKGREQVMEDTEAELSSQLEYELIATRQDLQSTIEQLETSNEELKASNEEVMSMNEELQSSNEELETSREELQSLNEELNTVNNQLEEKVHELEMVNNDLSNLLSSTEVATIFLDLNLRIRRFTPATHNVIHLIDSDIGRPLADLALTYRDKNLIRDARRVLETLQPSEKEVADGKGNHYLRRITLYRTTSSRIEGVVLTFTDVTAITGAMNQLKTRERQQAVAARFGQEALAETDLDALFQKAAQWSAEAVGVEMCKILELRNQGELFLRAGVGWKPGEVGNATISSNLGSQGGYTLTSKTPVIVDDLTTEQRFRGARFLLNHNVRSGMSVIIGPQDAPFGVLGLHTRRRRQFTQEDINFLQTMANGLWAAIQRDATLSQVKSQAMQLQLALHLGRMGTWRWDVEAGTAVWDQALFQMLGLPYSDEPVSSDLFFKRVHPDDLAGLRENIARVMKDETEFAHEYRIINAETGQVRWLAGYGGIHYSGKQQRRILYGVNYDITERKDYEVALRDREEWLRLALRSAELSSFWIDLNANEISHYSPTGEEAALDVSPEPIPLAAYLNRILAVDRKTVQETWQEAIENHDSFCIEYRLHYDGEIRWLRNWGQFVDLQGRPRLAGITMDISEEKENESRLQAAKQAADASNQAKSAFLANMSHEIRTPLTAILGYADLLHMELDHQSLSESYLQKIKTNGENLLEIINDVLDLSKVEADRIEIVRRRFPLKSLLGELLSLMHLRAQEKELGFDVEVMGKVPAIIDTDMGRLKQILANLISNAIKFTRHGSVRLEVSAAGDRQDTQLVFKVIDTGIGIEPEMLERIFDPFEQADASIAKKYGGTGLGLTISKRISDLLRAELKVDSELGKGSTFTLDLPIGSTTDVDYVTLDGLDTLVQEHEAPRVDSNQLNDVHVLVVDDIDDVLTLIQQMLKRAGARVSTASNGREALERVKSCDAAGDPVDIILMDTMMPVIDGYTAVKLLRNDGYDKPVVALTAAAMTNDRERCLQAGCDDYLSKPVSMERLLTVLRNQLGGSQPQPIVEGSARILVVEDNADAGEAIQALLNISGYECRLAADGESGIRKAEAFKPEVILLDLTLPDIDGYQVAERLQELRAVDRFRLIALSGQDLEQQWDRLKAAGFDAYLQKPVGREALAKFFPALEELGA